MAKTYYQKNGYDFFISINGQNVEKNLITDDIIVTHNKNQSAFARFTLLPGTGQQFPDAYQGASVTISVRCSLGIYRIFTGIIENPELDIISKKTTYICSDNREFKIKQLPFSYVHSIGVYSEIVFGKINDISDELSKRLSTVPYYFNFDSYGNPKLGAWTPKTSPDYTLTASQIYYRKPSVKYHARNKTTNTVSIDLTYEYQRCYQKKINYSWPGYSDLTQWLTTGRPSFPTRDGIISAAKATGWTITNVQLVALWPAQGVRINGGVVIWQPNEVSVKYTEKKDGNGNTLKDASGNPILVPSGITTVDTSSYLCRGAAWQAWKKWAQNLREHYTITIYSPQAVEKYGTNKINETYTVTSPYDPATWEESPIEKDFNSNSFRNQDNNRYLLNDTFNSVLQKAYVSLLQAHRDVEVNFQTPISPNIDILNTIEVNMAKLECKGIVTSITHTINILTTEAYTDVTLELSRMQGSATQSTLAPPPIPSENTDYNTFITQINLGTKLGVDYEKFPNANGYFGNVWTSGNVRTPGVRTQFTEAFIVDSPGISNTLRDTRNLYGTTSYTISVPNDPLIVRY